MYSFDSKDLEIARNSTSEILQALSSEGQKPTAELVGISESSLSRVKTHLEDTIKVMRALGYKAVSRDLKCYKPEVIQPYIELAKQRIAELDCATDLEDRE